MWKFAIVFMLGVSSSALAYWPRTAPVAAPGAAPVAAPVAAPAPPVVAEAASAAASVAAQTSAAAPRGLFQAGRRAQVLNAAGTVVGTIEVGGVLRLLEGFGVRDIALLEVSVDGDVQRFALTQGADPGVLTFTNTQTGLDATVALSGP